MRSCNPGIVAFFWDGGSPRPNRIRDASFAGAYIETAGRWYPGTVLSVMLQPQDPLNHAGRGPELVPQFSTVLPIYRPAAENRPLSGSKSSSSSSSLTSSSLGLDERAKGLQAPAAIRVTCVVVRQGDDGIAVKFPAGDHESPKLLRGFVAACVEYEKATQMAAENRSREVKRIAPVLLDRPNAQQKGHAIKDFVEDAAAGADQNVQQDMDEDDAWLGGPKASRKPSADDGLPIDDLFLSGILKDNSNGIRSQDPFQTYVRPPGRSTLMRWPSPASGRKTFKP